MSEYHTPVLLTESVSALVTNPSGIYADATFGGGGHTAGVLSRLHEDGFEARLLIQVHDELDFSVPAGEVEALSALVKDVMEHVVELKVPLIADVSSGQNWAQAH